MTTDQKLQGMRKAIEESKREKAKYEGQLEALLAQLKTQFGISSIEEAKKRQIELNAEIQNLQAEIDKGIAELESQYDFS